jgi:hypothetical protein
MCLYVLSAEHVSACVCTHQRPACVTEHLHVRQCSNTRKHTPEHLLVACVFVHAETHANTRKHTRQRSSLLPLCLSMLKTTQSTCMFVNIRTHANTRQSTCLLPVCLSMLKHTQTRARALACTWCLGNFAVLHWSSSCAHQHQPVNDAHAVYANAQKNHSEFVMGCVKFEEECECSSCVTTLKGLTLCMQEGTHAAVEVGIKSSVHVVQWLFSFFILHLTQRNVCAILCVCPC